MYTYNNCIIFVYIYTTKNLVSVYFDKPICLTAYCDSMITMSYLFFSWYGYIGWYKHMFPNSPSDSG